jgi:hypothetical protein
LPLIQYRRIQHDAPSSSPGRLYTKRDGNGEEIRGKSDWRFSGKINADVATPVHGRISDSGTVLRCRCMHILD